MKALLEVAGLTKRYGGVVALEGVDLTVGSGEVVGVIGPNGAGKSTLIGLISGALRASGGTIRLGGREVTHVAPEVRVRLGIARTYQIPQPFGRMTVFENVLVARRHARGAGAGGAEAAVWGILEKTGLAAFADQPAGDLTLIRLKRLEVARALALAPRLLLLDEVGAGLVPKELEELIALLVGLRGEVESLLVVEHVMDVIQAVCDRVAVLNGGRKMMEGTPGEVLAHPEVVAAYLGEGGRRRTAAAAVGEARVPALLEVRDVVAGYGEFRALDGVTLTVGEGEVVALLGANGAGKTTTARVVTGLVTPWSGTVTFAGERLNGKAAHEVVRLGIAHCMEGRRIFGDLTVEENLRLAVRRRLGKGEMEGRLERVYDLFPVLKRRRGDSGAALSGGEQQMLAVGRALMSEPRLIIFDEISLGLAPIVVDRLYEVLEAIHRQGVAMVIIEQNVERGLSLASWAFVLEKGRVALAGPAHQVRSDPRLKSLYVGNPA